MAASIPAERGRHRQFVERNGARIAAAARRDVDNVQATATDNAGNSATDPTHGELVVDTQKPTKVTLTPSPRRTNTFPLTLTGTVVDLGPVAGFQFWRNGHHRRAERPLTAKVTSTADPTTWNWTGDGAGVHAAAGRRIP